MTLEDVINDYGFESIEQFHKLVAASDISTPQKLRAFKIWQECNGTYEGILVLHEFYGTIN